MSYLSFILILNKKNSVPVIRKTENCKILRRPVIHID